MESVKRDPYKLVGTKLDRYLIQEVAGGGGMGVVYRAQHEITKGVVAIKVLRPDSPLNNDAGVAMFFEEAAKTVSLNHPSIVKVIGADYTPEGLAFMVMEWLDGQTLSDELYRHQTLPIERIADLLDQICGAVAFAHGKNIIHRDLKPGNIMLVANESGEESIRVLDFGIAKAMDNTVGTNTRIAGSYYYISPEQTVALGRIDRCTDIYSLGVMLYQMLTGKVPFEANTDGQIIDMHRSLDPVPLRQVNPAIPLGVEEVVLKALAKQAADRYQTATELARAFRHAAQLASGAIILECRDEHDSTPVATATVYLNGKHAGQTDRNGRWQQDELTPRKYLIEVEAPRYERWHLSESLDAREEITIPVALKRRPKGELVISCGVGGVEVEIDGAKIGKTDATGRLYLESVNAGSHTLRLTHSQYLPVESIVEIGVWEQALAALTMTERPRRQFGKQLLQKLRGASSPLSAAPIRRTETISPEPAKDAKFAAAAPTETLSQTPPASIEATSAAPPPTLVESVSATQLCPRCRHRMPAELKFCIECGAPLAAAETTVEATAEKSYNTQSLVSDAPTQTTAEAPVQEQSLPDLPETAEKEFLPYVTLPPTHIPSRKKNRTRWIVLGSAAALCLLVAWIIASRPSAHKEIAVTPTATPLPTSTPIQQEQTVPEGMVPIPGGSFLMGAPNAKPDDGTGPQHTVTVEPFFIGESEVTRGEYQAFLQDTNYPAPQNRDWKGSTPLPGTENLPVTDVIWDDAKAYTNWKSTQAPQFAGLRLPTEIEWEFVARDGKNQVFPWGNTFSDNANAGKKTKQLQPVKSPQYAIGEFKVYDLIGNAWEWMENDFYLYPGSRLRASDKPEKVIRGGTYDDSLQYAYSRLKIDPTVKGISYPQTGFRCAKSATK